MIPDFSVLEARNYLRSPLGFLNQSLQKISGADCFTVKLRELIEQVRVSSRSFSRHSLALGNLSLNCFISSLRKSDPFLRGFCPEYPSAESIHLRLHISGQLGEHVRQLINLTVLSETPGKTFPNGSP